MKITGVTSSGEHAGQARAAAFRTAKVVGVDDAIEVDSKIDFAASMPVVDRGLGSRCLATLLYSHQHFSLHDVVASGHRGPKQNRSQQAGLGYSRANH